MHFMKYMDIDVTQLTFNLGWDRANKPQITVTYGPNRGNVAMVTAPAITWWPRCTGDGNFGTMWGPTDASKAKFTLDLSDSEINGQANPDWEAFAAVATQIDDLLLEFVFENQQRILGRKNLSRDEVRMLQVRSIKPKYDKMSQALTGHVMNLSTSK